MCFPLLPDRSLSFEDQKRQGDHHSDCSDVAITTMVSDVTRDVSSASHKITEFSRASDVSTGKCSSSDKNRDTDVRRMEDIRHPYLSTIKGSFRLTPESMAIRNANILQKFLGKVCWLV